MLDVYDDSPALNQHWVNVSCENYSCFVALILVPRLQRWPNIKTTPGQRLVWE